VSGPCLAGVGDDARLDRLVVDDALQSSPGIAALLLAAASVSTERRVLLSTQSG